MGFNGGIRPSQWEAALEDAGALAARAIDGDSGGLYAPDAVIPDPAKQKPTRWQDGALAEEHMRVPTREELDTCLREMRSLHLPGHGEAWLTRARFDWSHKNGGERCYGEVLRPTRSFDREIPLAEFRVPRMPEIGSRWVRRNHPYPALKHEVSVVTAQGWKNEPWSVLCRLDTQSTSIRGEAKWPVEEWYTEFQPAPSALTIRGLENMAALSSNQRMVLLIGDTVLPFAACAGDSRKTIVAVATTMAARNGVTTGEARVMFERDYYEERERELMAWPRRNSPESRSMGEALGRAEFRKAFAGEAPSPSFTEIGAEAKKELERLYLGSARRDVKAGQTVTAKDARPLFHYTAEDIQKAVNTAPNVYDIVFGATLTTAPPISMESIRKATEELRAIPASQAKRAPAPGDAIMTVNGREHWFPIAQTQIRGPLREARRDRDILTNAQGFPGALSAVSDGPGSIRVTMKHDATRAEADAVFAWLKQHVPAAMVFAVVHEPKPIDPLTAYVTDQLADVPVGWTEERWRARVLALREGTSGRPAESALSWLKIRIGWARKDGPNKSWGDLSTANLADRPASPRWWKGETAPKPARMGRRR